MNMETEMEETRGSDRGLLKQLMGPTRATKSPYVGTTIPSSRSGPQYFIDSDVAYCR
jgi:hypothetical protein